MLPVARFWSSEDSLIRCASPPESVGAGCPSFTYPSPTSDRVCRCRLDDRDVLEELEGLVHAHLEHVGDRAVLVPHLEGLAVVPVPLADLARHVYVGRGSASRS